MRPVSFQLVEFMGSPASCHKSGGRAGLRPDLQNDDRKFCFKAGSYVGRK